MEEPADRGDQRLHAAGRHRELGEVALEHGRLALQLPAPVDEEADEPPLERGRVQAVDADRGQAGVRGRLAERGERVVRLAGGRVRAGRGGRGHEEQPRGAAAGERLGEVDEVGRGGGDDRERARRDDDEVGRLEDVQRRDPCPQHPDPAHAARVLAVRHRRADRVGVGQQRREDLVERGHRGKVCGTRRVRRVAACVTARPGSPSVPTGRVLTLAGTPERSNR